MAAPSPAFNNPSSSWTGAPRYWADDDAAWTAPLRPMRQVDEDDSATVVGASTGQAQHNQVEDDDDEDDDVTVVGQPTGQAQHQAILVEDDEDDDDTDIVVCECSATLPVGGRDRVRACCEGDDPGWCSNCLCSVCRKKQHESGLNVMAEDIREENESLGYPLNTQEAEDVRASLAHRYIFWWDDNGLHSVNRRCSTCAKAAS
ncbi:hypothetical protein NpPPO83_00006683 [Neofusicoccum parvum]|uniref:Uncharacterized protein n=1 Tax=Neofusicoccum parvum TaxID=310453 RepID=A0ACB5SE07_9PEZI|nr:hypothetical protein NpPPO83_00006683 [Neofusicoccum parvum]